MNNTKIINYLKQKWKLLFCYLLILMGVLLILIVLIIRPIKKTTDYLYSQSEESILTEVKFPLQEKIKISNNKLTSLWLVLGDDSINNYVYEITLTNPSGKVYYQNIYNNYNSNIIRMDLGIIEKSYNEDLTLTIDCEECKDIKVETNGTKKDSYIVENMDRTLKIYYDYYIENNTFYWYSIMAIVIGLLLIPFAKEND